jgi:excisionase family DNA binding protein
VRAFYTELVSDAKTLVEDFMGEKYLTLDEVASETRAKKRTVRDWLSERKLGCVKIGGRVRVPRAELDRFLAAGARPALVRDYKMAACGPDA